jgi:hypothetical protein
MCDNFYSRCMEDCYDNSTSVIIHDGEFEFGVRLGNVEYKNRGFKYTLSIDDKFSVYVKKYESQYGNVILKSNYDYSNTRSSFNSRHMIEGETSSEELVKYLVELMNRNVPLSNRPSMVSKFNDKKLERKAMNIEISQLMRNRKLDSIL